MIATSSDQSTPDFLADLYGRRDEFLREDRYRTIADAEQFFTKIAGVSFEGRQDIVRGLRAGDVLALRAEPENPYDANALAVMYGALQLGYLRRELSAKLAPEIAAGRKYDITVASVNGGEGRRFGINVHLKRAGYSFSLAPVERDRSMHPADREALRYALLGDRALRESQVQVIDRVMNGGATLAVLGTGRGKSMCFQLPAAIRAVEEGKKTLVLYPLRALANDQFEALRAKLEPLGLRILRANGAIDGGEREALNEALESGSWDLILTTPEFVKFHGDRFALEQNIPWLVVIDEAHHVYESKHRPAYGGVGKFLLRLPGATVLALTATAKTETFRELCEALRIDKWVIDPTIRENLSIVDARGTKDKSRYILDAIEDDGKAIIYCNSRTEATKVAEYLRTTLATTAFYHAGLANPERAEVERRFRSGEIRVVVATSAFGEGIDLPDVRDVFLYHLNFNFTEFNQQAGRAGRDGMPARIHLLYGEADRRINDFIISKSAPTVGILREIYRGLRGLADEDGTIRMSFADIARTLEIDRAEDGTISVAARIFADAELVVLGTDDEGRFIRLLPTSGKIDITATARFEEGEADRDAFERFCGIALHAAPEDLERIINRPMYPTNVPLLR